MRRGGTAIGLLFSLAALGSAAPPSNPVLVLMEPSVAVPAAARGLYVEDAWVRWPRQDGATGNRLLSLLTGEDWRGDPADYRFTQTGRDEWRAGNLASLRARGYFAAKQAAGMLALGPGRSRDVLLLAADERGPVRPFGLRDRWPEGRLVVCQASGWDDVAAIQRATTGRVLVLEYPPMEKEELSRAWLRGSDWPTGRTNMAGTSLPALPSYKSTGSTPGLIPAREVGRLLGKDPDPLWVPDPGAAWPGADRWIRYVRDVGMGARAALGVLAFGLLVWGLRLVADERRSKAYFVAVSAFALVVPVVVLAGNLASVGGMAIWPVWFPIAGLAVGAIGAGLYLLARRKLPLTHRFWPVAGVAALAIFLSAPIFSALSGPLDSFPRQVSAEPLGLALVCVLVLVGGARGEQGRAAVVGYGVAFLFALLLREHGFAVGFLPFLAFLAAGQRFRIGFRWWMGLVLLPLTEGAQALVRGGVVYREGALIRTWAEREAFDLAPVVRFLISPAVLVGALVLGAALVFTPAFATHQLRRVWGRSPLVRALVGLGLALLPVGVFQAPVLDAAYIVFAAAVFVLLAEAVWTSPELG